MVCRFLLKHLLYRVCDYKYIIYTDACSINSVSTQFAFAFLIIWPYTIPNTGCTISSQTYILLSLLWLSESAPIVVHPVFILSVRSVCVTLWYFIRIPLMSNCGFDRHACKSSCLYLDDVRNTRSIINQ